MLWPGLMLAAFLCGSIPFALLIGRAHGIDLRQHGSGNLGATNVGRVLGSRAFALCFTLDMLKGLLPTLGAGWAAGLLGHTDLPPAQAWLWLAVMALTVFGHMFSPWVGFKGGKGVATGLGALLGVFPVLTVPGLATLGVWLAFAAIWRYVSLASCAAAVTLPVWVVAWFLFAGGGEADAPRRAAFGSMLPFLIVTLALAALVIWKHRGNIRRLLAGSEPKIGVRVAAPAVPPNPGRGA